MLVALIAPTVSGQELVQRVSAHHREYVPSGRGPFPAVIAIPGCSGVSLRGASTDAGRAADEGDRLFRRHYPREAERLKDMGFAVLLIDYLSAENVRNACGGEVQPNRIAEYIIASIDFARTRPFIDRSRLYVIAWSLGGSGLLSWLERLGAKPAPVNSAVVVYPGCAAAHPWASRLRVLMLLGGADDIAPPEQCQSVVQAMPRTARVRVRTFPGARHGFDLTEGPTVLELGGGKTIGRDSSAGDASWREMLDVLKQ